MKNQETTKVRVKEYRYVTGPGASGNVEIHTRVVEIDQALPGAEITEEPVRDWQKEEDK